MRSILEEWIPVIGSYAISVISYILLIVNTISNRKRNTGMHAVVKDKVIYVDEEVSKLQTYLGVLEKKHDDAILEIAKLQSRCRELGDELQTRCDKLGQTLMSVLEVENERDTGQDDA